MSHMKTPSLGHAVNDGTNCRVAALPQRRTAIRAMALALSAVLAWALLAACPVLAHAGSIDRYIGLDKRYLIVATAHGTNDQFKPIYAKASAKSRKISKIQGRSCLVCTTSGMKKGEANSFVKVKLPTCKPSHGYIRTSDFDFDTIDTKTFGLTSRSGSNLQRILACNHALSFLGAKYSNANSLNKHAGLNCRHLVLRAYNVAGHKVWASRAYKMNNSHYGKKITKADLRAGDMVFYKGYNGRNYNHMALYLGKGYVIQSTCDKGKHYPTGGVRITKMKFRALPQVYRDALH